MSALLALVIGLVVGWHLPEPSWAKALWSKVANVFNKQ